MNHPIDRTNPRYRKAFLPVIYSDSGARKTALIPKDVIVASKTVEEAFTRFTNLPVSAIVSYTNKTVDEKGNPAGIFVGIKGKSELDPVLVPYAHTVAASKIGLARWARLPKQVKELIFQQEERIKQLESVEAMNAITAEPKRDWTTVPNMSRDTTMRLWILDKDHPFPVCELAPGDTLFLGRAKRRD